MAFALLKPQLGSCLTIILSPNHNGQQWRIHCDIMLGDIIWVYSYRYGFACCTPQWAWPSILFYVCFHMLYWIAILKSCFSDPHWLCLYRNIIAVFFYFVRLHTYISNLSLASCCLITDKGLAPLKGKQHSHYMWEFQVQIGCYTIWRLSNSGYHSSHINIEMDCLLILLLYLYSHILLKK